MPTKIKYSDIDFSFSMNSISKDVNIKTNENSIKQSLKNIILTRKQERPFKGNIGANIFDSLFENFDFRFISKFTSMIKEQLEAFEPRVKIIDVDIDPDKVDSNELNVDVTFEYITGYKTEPIQDFISVQLERVR